MNTRDASRVTPLREPETDRAPQLPANTEAEQALLGAILVNNAAHGRVAGFLLPEHFGNAVHGRIFAAIGKLIERGQIANPITLKNLFDQDGALQEIGGVQYLARLAASAVTIINTQFYGETIYDLFLRRELITLGQDIIDGAHKHDLDVSASQQIEGASNRLFELGAQAGNRKTLVTLAEAADASIAATQDAYSRDRHLAGISTGIRRLDEIIGGLAGGDFIIIGGRPGSGKSALMGSVAWSALLEGVPVHIFSGEMRARDLAARMMAALSGISAGRQRRGDVSGRDFDELLRARQTLADWPCYIDDGRLVLSKMRQQMRALHRQKKTGIVFVDHLQLVRIGGEDDERPGGRNFEVGRISNALKAMSLELDIPIVALSQLSRDVEDRDDKRPRADDLRNAGELEQDADVISLIFREEVYLAKAEPTQRDRESDIDFQARWSKWSNRLEYVRGRAELLCVKVRSDDPGVAEVAFDGARSFFHDLPGTTGTLL